MSLRVFSMPPEALGWLCERAGCAWTPNLRAIWAIDKHGKIHGAVGFDGWLGNAAQMHIALENPLALRALIRPAFDVIFNQAGKDIAMAVIPSHNERSLRMVTHAGFRVAYRLKDGWAPGDDMILLEMRREDCQWLEEAPYRKAS